MNVTRRKAIASGSVVAIGSLTGCLGALFEEERFNSDLDGGPEQYPDVEQPEYRFNISDEESTITAEWYTDYQCSSCETYYRTIIQPSETRFENLRVVKYDFPVVGSLSVPLANLVYEHSAQFGPRRNEVYDAINRIYNYDNRFQDIDALVEELSQVNGIDEPRLFEVMEIGQYNQLIRQHVERGEDLGVDRTPTIIMDGEILEDPFDVEQYP